MSTRKAPAKADGGAYVAQTRLTNKAGDVLADVGERCDKVPASSLDWLIAQGLIVQKDEA